MLSGGTVFAYAVAREVEEGEHQIDERAVLRDCHIVLNCCFLRGWDFFHDMYRTNWCRLSRLGSSSSESTCCSALRGNLMETFRA